MAQVQILRTGARQFAYLHTDGSPAFRTAFFGRTTEPRTVGPYTLTLSSHAKGGRTPWHFHKDPYICVVLGGLFTEVGEGYDTLFEPGVGIFHPSGHEHEDVFHSHAECLNVTVDSGLSANAPQIRKAKRFSCYARSIARSLDRAEHDCLQLEASSMALVSYFEPGEAPPWLSAAKRFVDGRFCLQLPVKRIALLFDVSPVHFARAFRSLYGLGYEQYLDGVRLTEAERLLRTTDASVSAVSDRCGFSEPSRLSNLLRMKRGVSPTAFRAASTL